LHPLPAFRTDCKAGISFFLAGSRPLQQNPCEPATIPVMTDQQISYLPYDQALKTVGAIQEEEHPHELNRRIFTVYDHHGKEICWFDAEDTIAIVAPGKINPKKTEVQPLVEDYILNHIPDWNMEQDES
jgi:hypothetical protein